MILDRSVTNIEGSIECDVCVIGAGPAGLAIALELEESGLRVAVLEAGGARTAFRETTLLRAPQGATDFDLPARERRAGFGGTAGAWAVPLSWRALGLRYSALSAADLEQRAWLPHSGWPIGFEELSRYVDRALTLAGVAGVAADLDPATADEADWPFDRSRIVVRRDYFGRADVFTERALARLRRAESVTVHLRSPVVSLETGAGGRIASVRVAAADGQSHTVRARWFVLAGGAIENARLLLVSGDVEAGGVGNAHGWVGRGYHDHLRLVSGRLVPADRTLFDDSAGFAMQHDSGSPRMARLGIADELLRGEPMLNSLAQLIPRAADTHRHGLRRLRRAADRARRRDWRTAASDVRGAGTALGYGAWTAAELMIAQRSFPPSPEIGWGGLRRKSRRFVHFDVEHQLEQAPNPENRVVLGRSWDRFGMRTVELHWRWSELDLESLRRTQELFREETRRAGLGEYVPVDWDERPELTTPAGAAHPGGTTRMASDPAQGVVDADCRVHSVPNLFVAGSSVFPTGGAANPTLTILALAIRLADQLRSQR